jgi:hypothetical protein
MAECSAEPDPLAAIRADVVPGVGAPAAGE